MTISIPLIDMREASSESGRGELAVQIDDALHRYGFIAVTGHGVDPALVEKMFQVVNAFFAMPLDVKLRCSPNTPRTARGYSFVGAVAQANAHDVPTKPDITETFSAGIDPVPDTPYYHDAAAMFPRNIWPADPPELPAVWLRYLAAMDLLAERIMSLMAEALGLQPDYFAPLIDKPMASITANHYPALESDPDAGQFRGGAHTDYGSITLLATDNVPGLQLQDESGAWTGVDPVPGAFHVNTGDLLSYWSGGRWRSTWHRVMPPEGPPPHPARTSLAYFHSPNADCLITPLPGVDAAADVEPILAGAYLRSKIDRYYVGATTTNNLRTEQPAG